MDIPKPLFKVNKYQPFSVLNPRKFVYFNKNN